jgi:rhamnulokinase
MMGLDQNWAQEAFQIAGWPVPDLQPVAPGGVIAKLTESVDLVRVGSHDTASAVRGFGSLAEDEIFLNIGTWSIVGCLLERPLVSPEAESNNWSNEIAVDGRARFLKNVPGLYVVNRLHQELGVTEPIGTWLAAGCPDFGGRFDVFHPDLYNPEFMVQACSALVDEKPHSNSQWATAALGSLVDALAAQIRGLSGITGRTYRGLRVGGGGSQSPALCQALARATGFPVKAGPAEATVLGNLGVQFAASGRTSSLDAMLGHSRNLHYGSET